MKSVVLLEANLGSQIWGISKYLDAGLTLVLLQKKFPNSKKLLLAAILARYLVGYQSENIYKIWSPERRSIETCRHVKFDEDVFFDTEKPVRIPQIDKPIENVVLAWDASDAVNIEAIPSDSDSSEDEGVDTCDKIDKGAPPGAKPASVEPADIPLAAALTPPGSEPPSPSSYTTTRMPGTFDFLESSPQLPVEGPPHTWKTTGRARSASLQALPVRHGAEMTYPKNLASPIFSPESAQESPKKHSLRQLRRRANIQ